MLQTGKQGADKKYLDNMFLVKGYVGELLFLDNSSDIVFSCLVFHHCTNVQSIFCIFWK
ncbi:TPA: methyltransferase domain-containing protein [Clostridioides difficile]|nr:methyltransferase domain-containing protein [Clostridioides difficile]MCI9995177.1 methyltransferase domain-containing protein [Clostridioides difficile]HBF5908190.1 methyltransferase domain-containing protein [Clostridioides difficile]HBF6292243.1 methyltransferase domain-containing protein [Clostridioides difficile]HBG4073746.1 methyltransferase domain-containing protein [Clostridioides difficile]